MRGKCAEYTHIDGYVANHGGVIRQSDVLRLVGAPGTISVAVDVAEQPRRGSWFRRLDDEGALDVDLDGAGMTNGTAYLCG